MNECTPAMLLFVVLLAIAGGTKAAPTAPPLIVDATAKPSTTDLDTLTAHTWQWVSFNNPVESFDVASPANYTLTFNSDGIVSIVADCNKAIASYGVKSYEAGTLAMVVAPKTKAACPSKSRGNQFLLLLGRAARYFFKDSQLFIDLTADGGTMVFAPAEADSPTSASARAPGTPAEPQH